MLLLPLSVVCTECIVAKRCVLEQTLQPIGSCIWEIGWYQNEWPWTLFRGCVKVMSTIASHRPLRRWISRKPLDIETWLQRTTNMKWPMEYQMVTWPMTSRDPERSNSWHKYAWKQLEMLFSNNRCLLNCLLWGSTVGYPSDSLASLMTLGGSEYRWNCFQSSLSVTGIWLTFSWLNFVISGINTVRYFAIAGDRESHTV